MHVCVGTVAALLSALFLLLLFPLLQISPDLILIPDQNPASECAHVLSSSFNPGSGWRGGLPCEFAESPPILRPRSSTGEDGSLVLCVRTTLCSSRPHKSLLLREFCKKKMQKGLDKTGRPLSRATSIVRHLAYVK